MLYNLLKQVIIAAVLLLFIGLIVSPSIGSIVGNDSIIFPYFNKTIYVGGSGEGNFTFIQDAIDNASNGDTVYVYNGSYLENLKVTKPIFLKGECKQNTIIDGCKRDSSVYIECNNVHIENFTITNSSSYNVVRAINTGGIKLKNSKGSVITNNIIKDNYNGIYGLRSINLSICKNEFFNDGISFSPYDEGERPKIYKKYYLHNIENNTVNGKELLYLKNQNYLEISSGIGQLIMINCSQIKVKNISFSNTDNAILMAFCSHCIIEHTTITDSGGVWALQSDHNIFQFNNFSNSYIHGITLDYKSNYNLIKRNIISYNKYMGVMIEYYSKFNCICYNNLIKNPNNGFLIQAFRNKWHNNYWDDWIGIDHKIIALLFPKIIFGILIDKTNIPLINFDWHPAKQSYNIKINN